MGIRSRVAIGIAALLGTVAPSLAQVSSGPAALVVFPYLLVDPSEGRDTVVQLGNTSSDPVEVRCIYEDTNPTCTGTGTCIPDPSRCNGSCVLQWFTEAFRLRLTANQPLAWSVERGLSTPPLGGASAPGTDGESNVGTRVPAVTAPFRGAMRCVVVDDQGRPTDRNVLVGTASIETDAGVTPPASHTPYLDAAQYDAIGLAAQAGANDGDEILQLGGPQPEYAGCPNTLVLSHFLDGATVPIGVEAGTVSTTLALVPCGGDLLGATAPGTTVQFLIYNEFAQRFTTSKSVTGNAAFPLSLIDSLQPQRSIFSVGVSGTLTAQTLVQGINLALLGVAIETHQFGAAAGDARHAALPLGADGVPTDPQLLAALEPACAGDCNGDGHVGIDELILAVNIALGQSAVQACLAADGDDSGEVQINELLGAVRSALSSCPARKVPTTPTAPPITPTPTPTLPTMPGPDITFLGIASGDDVPQDPVGTDDQGRPIFSWPRGQGFSLIIEARPGIDRTPVAVHAADTTGAALPDLQVILSNPIGDGSAALCDADPPNPGGVPAVTPFAFSDAPDIVLAINDLGCRADDGQGMPMGRRGSWCTRQVPSGDLAPVSAVSQVQFCVPIARAWAFPIGDTTVAARVRNTLGTVGPAREMIIRIPPAP
jgi:hypothetical protein